MYLKKSLLITIMTLVAIAMNAQDKLEKDKLIFKERKSGFYQDSILTGIKQFQEKEQSGSHRTYPSMEFSGYSFPVDPDQYHQYWHNDPVSQGSTGTCWCFAATSFLESEVFRITGKKIKLSEMYFVYWEYVARAEYFVEHRGEMYFGQGSESNGVTRTMIDHGIVPLSVYSGMQPGQKYHAHGEMFKEIKGFLNDVEKQNLWNKELVISTVKSILNHYIGTPPEKFTVDGENFTPVEYMNFLKLKPVDYFCFMSTKSLPYNQKGELAEPDNWWHSDDYYNVSLDDFFQVIRGALENNYTVSICGDVSEPGYDRYEEVGIIPTFDIPGEYINADSREYRIDNNSTTDDHCIHIVGYRKADDGYWFMIKDSSSSAFDGPHKGYRFMREDYIKLKILAVMTYKYAAKDILDKIIK